MFVDRYPSAEQLTRALGGKWNGREGRCQCPAHGGDDNFTIHDGEERPRMYCRTQECDFRDIIGALRARSLWPGSNLDGWKPPKPAPRSKSAPQTDKERLDKARRIWEGTKPLSGTLSDRYLRKTRKRNPSGIRDLRHHDRIYISPTEHHPALVAAIRNIHSGEIQGVHRTFLTNQATKIDRMVKGYAKGGAIMLDPSDEVTTGLAICEGVEDGLAVRTIQRPVWSLINKGGISAFPVLTGIDHLTIYADNDDAGRDAANNCRMRWNAAGIDVTVKTAMGGKDADEVLP